MLLLFPLYSTLVSTLPERDRSQYSHIIIIIIVVVSLLVHTFDNNVVTTLSLILISYTLDRQYENLFLYCQICKFQFIVETRRLPNDQHKLECKIRLVISLQSTALIPRRRLFITLVKMALSNIELVQLMGTSSNPMRWLGKRLNAVDKGDLDR